MSVINSFSSGTVISSSQVNANFTDIADEITNSLALDGQSTMSGALKAADGTSSAPGITFGGDTDTGFYRSGANTFKAVTATGTVIATFDSSGIKALSETGYLSNPTTTRGDLMYRGASVLGRLAVGTVGQALVSDGTDPAWASKNTFASDAALINGKLSLSVAASALTIAVKTLAGSDPSSSDAVFVRIPDGSGGFNYRSITSALSVVVSSGSTLGTTNSVAFRLWIGVLDNSGAELFVVNARSSKDIVAPAEFSTVTTTAEGGSGGADTAQVPYSTSARATKQFRWVGFATWESGLATAGTWSAGPTSVYMVTPTTPRPGAPTGLFKRVAKTSVSTIAITAGTFADATGVTVSITPNSAANLIRCAANVTFGAAAGSRQISAYIMRGSTVVEQADTASNRSRGAAVVNIQSNAVCDTVALEAYDFPASTSSTTYKVQFTGGSTENEYINQSGQDTDATTHARGASWIFVEEIMG